MNPPSNIVDIYKSQGWNDDAAIQGDIANGGWQSKVPSTGGTASGGNAYDNFDMSKIPSSLDFAKGLGASEDAAFQDYLKATQSQESPMSAYSRLEGEAGLPQLRKTSSTLSGQINDIEDTIKMIEPDVSARSQNSFMTEAQRRGTVTARKEPLLNNLDSLGTALGRITQGIDRATSDIGTKVGLIMQSQDRALEPLKMHISMLSDRNARLMTGFTSDKETTLQVLFKKMDAQQSLNNAEMQQVNDLAKLKLQYDQEKDSFNQQTQIVTVGGRVKLINSVTGQVVSDLGSSKDPSSGGGGSAKDYLDDDIEAPSSTFTMPDLGTFWKK
jgi:hypothetical protein